MSSRYNISFEFSPPTSPAVSETILEAVADLALLDPDFISVTYGAGGSTRDRTLTAITRMVELQRFDVAGHLTCVNDSRESVLRVAQQYQRLGVHRIVALRGDPPAGSERFVTADGGFANALELVEALAQKGGFEIYVAAYPETHPEATSAQADIEVLKLKQDAGASAAITQFFFDNEDFLRFCDHCRKAGITIPIIPGIIAINSFSGVSRFAKKCGSKIPSWMHEAYEKTSNRAQQIQLSVEIGTRQCDELLREGVEHLHFYTLNKSDITRQICLALGRKISSAK